jgi:hypothetical protein
MNNPISDISSTIESLDSLTHLELLTDVTEIIK